MKPAEFPEANVEFQAPEGMSEICHPLRGAVVSVSGGPHDGTRIVIVAWKPEEEDLRRLNAGGVVYLHFLERAVVHYVSTELMTLHHTPS